jgi:hypothetical protein
MYLVCVHLIYLAMRCSYVAGHLENMTVSPCLDMATLSIGADLWYTLYRIQNRDRESVQQPYSWGPEPKGSKLLLNLKF